MSQVVSIYRYPVKGLSAEALSRAQLEAEKPFPHDRVFALARPTAPIDAINPQWAKKGLFAMLMLDEGLARVTTELDLGDLRLTVRRKGQVAISGRLDVEDDRRRPSSGRCCRTSPARRFCCARVAAISWTSRTM
jgi:GntR family transcriptional regulator/MocR family aminotransferase